MFDGGEPEAAPPNPPTRPYPLATRFVGREDAQRRLVQAFDRARGGAIVMTLVGAAGSGKSRLVHELRLALGARARVWQGSSAQPRLPYGPFAGALADRLGLTIGEGPEHARHKIAEAVRARLPEAQQVETIHLFAQLLGVGIADSPVVERLADLPRQLEARTFMALRRFLAADAARAPVLLVLEDFDQASADSNTLLHYLAAGLGSAAVLLLVVARPELFERHPEIGTGETPVEEVVLDPLTGEEAERLMHELLRPAGGAPNALVAHARAIGDTPRTLVDLVRWLVETETIARAGGGWRIDRARLARLELPAHHADITAARLARLASDDRDLLAKAAACGERCWLDGLVAITRADHFVDASPDGPNLAGVNDRSRLQVAERLERLVERAFLVEQPTTILGTREFRFASAALAELVAAELPDEALRRYHRWIAYWLELRPDGRDDDALEEIASHLALAGEREQAMASYRRAAHAARAVYANDRAVRLYARALACATDGNLPVRIHLWHDLGSVYELRGDFDAALAAFERMLRLTWITASRSKAAVALNKLGRVWRRKGDLAQALQTLQRAYGLFLECGDARGIAGSLDDIGQVLYLLGRYDEALEQIGEALHRRGAGGDPRSIAHSLSNLGNVHKDRGSFDEAERCHTEALELRRTAGDRAGIVLSQANLAALSFERGDRDQARFNWEHALAEAERMGAVPIVALLMANLGELALVENKPDEARRRLEEAATLAREFDDRRLASDATRNLGLLELDAGNLARARDLVTGALHLAQAAGLADQIGRAELALGEIDAATLVDAAAEEPPTAEGHFAKAIEMFRAIGNAAVLAKGLERYGRHRLERGDTSSGRAFLEEAHAIYARLGVKGIDTVSKLLAEF